MSTYVYIYTQNTYTQWHTLQYTMSQAAHEVSPSIGQNRCFGNAWHIQFTVYSNKPQHQFINVDQSGTSAGVKVWRLGGTSAGQQLTEPEGRPESSSWANSWDKSPDSFNKAELWANTRTNAVREGRDWQVVSECTTLVKVCRYWQRR